MSKLNISELEIQRNDVLFEVRELAAKAESEGRGFTEAEQKVCNEGLAKAKEFNEQIKRIKGINETRDQIGALMAADEGDPFDTKADSTRRATRTALSRQFSKSLFGDSSDGSLGANLYVDRSGLHTKPSFDSDGYSRAQKASPLHSPSGRITVAVGRRADGGGVILLPEFGANLLGLYTQPLLTSDDRYKGHRQTATEKDAAEFVPLLETKPEAAFEYEVFEDRVRTIAVLSEPIPVQNLRDIPLLREDIADYLAARVIWKLENATVNGNPDLDAESFEGILNTTGVLNQSYTVSPARTIRKSLTRLELAGYDPAELVVAMHPDAWEDIETAEDDEGRPLYPNLYTSRQEPILYGRKVVLTDKLADTSAIVADWRFGGVTIRDQIELSWTDGGELFDTNAVKFRAEMRAGFNLSQPGAFIHATLEAGEAPEEEPEGD